MGSKSETVDWQIMFNQYILEAKYLDAIKRVKRKHIVGVYTNLEKVEDAKQKLLDETSKYTLRFTITPHFNPFLERVA
jgi:hypothetical protein